MTAQQTSPKDVEKVGLRLFEIVNRMIHERRKAISPENLMAQAVKEAGLR